MYPQKYNPKTLSKKDSRKTHSHLLKLKKEYKKGNYINRPKTNYKSKKSSHVLRAKEIYKVDSIVPSKKLSKRTGCSLKTLNLITKKGRGAYYSSGSRPNQTAQSWARARLASAITGGKASLVDYHLLLNGCSKSSKALRFASKTKKNLKKK